MNAASEPGAVRFRTEREKRWRQLEALLDRVDANGIHSLSAIDALLLPQLYRNALSSLAVARATSLDRNLLAYLEALSARAFLVVHGSKEGLFETLKHFFAVGFPRAVRAARIEFAIALSILLAGVLVGAVLVLHDPEWFHSFVAPELSAGRGPYSSAEELRKPLYDGAETGAEELVQFASWLLGHNAQIGLLAFALGFLAGVPVFLLLLVNGVMLGAFFAIYQRVGLSVELWAWILPHGITELLGVVLGGTAGLLVARGILFPGRWSRRASLKLYGRQAAAIAGGAVALFAIAALIEGIFRQRVHSVPIRYGVAITTAIAWCLYFVCVSREPLPSRDRESTR